MSEHFPGTSKGQILRVVIISGLVLVVGIGGMRALFKMKKKPVRKGVAQQTIRVETQKVRPQALHLHLDGLGTAEANKVVALAPELSGRVVYVSPKFRTGARVRRGALLLRVDSRSYSLEYKRLKRQLRALRKQIKISEQALTLNRRLLQRNRRLLQRKAIDTGSYEQQRMQMLDRQQRLESLRQSAELTEVQLSNAGLTLRKTQIRAPFDARIVQTNIDRGDFVTAGRTVATVESRDAVLIPVSFPIDSIRSIRTKEGKSVDIEALPGYLSSLPPVQVTASGDSSQSWKGKVVRVGAKLDLTSRTLALWIKVDLQNKRKRRKASKVPTLLPGTFCKVQIPIQYTPNAIAIPKQALYGNSVYVVEDSRIRKRQVEITHQTTQRVFIQSGLRAGDLLIVSPLTDPLEGTQVAVSRKSKSAGLHRRRPKLAQTHP
ncbi:MAG: efflux RND transporter periplasmic adaptor subunit [Deltaproteobacteria bacterium]|nr:MAG: efflux RND transporter periplasmic adaptor subunit [Deltaproteobacteria bacterium]